MTTKKRQHGHIGKTKNALGKKIWLEQGGDCAKTEAYFEAKVLQKRHRKVRLVVSDRIGNYVDKLSRPATY